MGERSEETACVILMEVRIMAASGMWQDLRDGLDQAETICGDMLRNRRAARCERGRSGESGRSLLPGLDLLVWRTPPGGACGGGGEDL